MESLSLSFPGDRDVPWFPQKARDLDLTVETLDGGTDLINDVRAPPVSRPFLLSPAGPPGLP
jgi:hypothetical protein